MFTTPQKLTFMTRSMMSKSRSWIFTNGWMMPATLKSPSTWPWALMTAAGRASTALRSDTLSACVVRFLPAPASFAVSARPASLRSTAATRAPRFEQAEGDLAPHAVAAAGDDEDLVCDLH